jgi:peptidyl-prolyl cis-trans isomerase D
MSALQFLREKAGVLVAAVIGISLFLFVVSDFFGKGRGQRIKARKYYEIGEIGGQYISYQDYEQRLQNLMEIYKLSGRTNIDEATNESLREQVWQQMIREKILDTQYKKLGVGVSTEEVDELVLGNRPHPIVQQLFTDQQSGAFNKSMLVNFLKQTEVDPTAKKYWMFFEDEIVNDRENTKYNTLVSKGLYVTSKQAEFEKSLNSKTVDFSYTLKNFASVSDSLVRISESDMHDYYNAHQNNYYRTALRDVEYVTFNVVPSEDDIKQTKDWITSAKADFAASDDPVEFINTTSDTRHTGFYVPFSEVPDSLKDFVKKEDLKTVYGPYMEDGSFKMARLLDVANRPDSVHVRHILLATGQNRSVKVAKHEADSLVALIKSGTSFASIAQANSDDQGSAQLGGDLGWFTEGKMVLPFNNASFSGKKGDIKIVETTYGVHIIDILDESKPVRKYNIGIIDRKILPSSATSQKYYSEASQFAGLNNTYEKFNKAIAEQGLNKRIANDVAPLQKTLPGLENPRPLIMALFQTTEKDKIVLDNNQQAIFEIGDNYVVAYCTRVQETGIAPMKDVENDIRFALIKEKKADIISAEFEKNMASNKNIEALAQAMNLNVEEATNINFRSFTVQGVGTEPALIAASTVGKEGVLSGPVKGINGVYMLEVNNITTPQVGDIKAIQQRMESTFRMRGSYEAYEALKKDASIVDKRYKFY